MHKNIVQWIKLSKPFCLLDTKNGTFRLLYRHCNNTLARDWPGGKCSLARNIKAQHKIRGKGMIKFLYIFTFHCIHHWLLYVNLQMKYSRVMLEVGYI